MTLGNDNGTDGQTDRQTDGQTECDAVCGPPPREEGRIIMIADVPLVLNNVLCFMANKYVKTTVKSLKTILTYFFSADELAAAKAQLIMDMDN